MLHAYGPPAPRWSGLTREMALDILKLHRDRVALPEDLLAEARRVAGESKAR